jgi:hypothetical protein
MPSSCAAALGSRNSRWISCMVIASMPVVLASGIVLLVDMSRSASSWFGDLAP